MKYEPSYPVIDRECLRGIRLSERWGAQYLILAWTSRNTDYAYARNESERDTKIKHFMIAGYHFESMPISEAIRRAEA